MRPPAKETKEIFSRLLDNTGVIVVFLDEAGKVIFCNRKTDTLTGIGNDAVGADWLKLLYRNENTTIKQDMLEAVLDECVRHKRVKDFEGVVLDANGNERIISWNIAPVPGRSGKTEASVLVGHDVTEFRQSGSSAKNIDQTLKDIFSGLKEYALYAINLEGNITYFGMGSEIMLGWRRNEIIFKHAGILHNMKGSENILDSILEQVRLYGKYEKETALTGKTGEAIPVALTANKFFNSEGKHSGYIFIAKDITERKKLEYEAFQAEKLAALGLLSAGIAHEINNPLLVISGRSALLAREDLSPEIIRDLDLINSQAERIQKMVDRILKFAQKTRPVFGPVDINEAIEFVLPFAQYGNLPNARVDIEKDFMENLRPVRGDEHQLQEVFLNLIINAHQSMPQGGRIAITTGRTDDNSAFIRIRDTGVGIPEEHLKDVFMPFYSTKNDGKGLGLSICHNIIKNHNGSIELESQMGKGSVFTIKLPFM